MNIIPTFVLIALSLLFTPTIPSPVVASEVNGQAVVVATGAPAAGNPVDTGQGKRNDRLTRKPAHDRTASAGAPVTVGKDTLFFVQERVLSFSPEDRARAVSDRIRSIMKNALVSLESITVVEDETTSDIVAGDLIIMSVTDRDARAAGLTRQELAREHAQSIRTALEAQIQARSVKVILTAAGLFLLATAVLVTSIWLLRLVFAKLAIKVASWEGTRIKPLRFQSLEILSAGRIVAILLKTLKGLRLAVVLLLFYVYIPMVLNFFPWTHGAASLLYGYMIAPLVTIVQSFLAFIPNLLFIVVIVVVIRYVIKGIRFVFSALASGAISLPGFYRDWAMPTFNIVRFLFIVFGAVVTFPYLPGSKSPAFQGISIFLGVLFSLGSTSAVANMVAGVILTYMRPFKLGDRVKIADTMGDVIEKTLLVTRITTIKNVDITIPNAMVLGSHISNYSSSAKEAGLGLILNTTVTIGYDVPWRKVHELLMAAAGSVENVQKEPAPFVLQTALDDFFVRYELNCSTNEPGLMARTYSELHQNIQDRFNDAGVEIMSPHYSSLRDGNRSTIPEEHLPKSYKAPVFRIDLPENMPHQQNTKKEPAEG